MLDKLNWPTAVVMLGAMFLVGGAVATGHATLPAGVTRLEVRIRYAEDPVVDVDPVDIPAAGARMLTYTIATPAATRRSASRMTW